MTAKGMELSQERRWAAERFGNVALTGVGRETFEAVAWRCATGGDEAPAYDRAAACAAKIARLIDSMCCYGPPDEDGWTVCSECGCEVEAESASGWNFCPECGRRIVREENDDSWEDE